MKWKLSRIVVTAPLLICCSLSVGQTVPWLTFDDPLSQSICDVVNSADDELVVIPDFDGVTGRLMIVTGPVDVLIENSVVVLDPLAFVDEVFLWDVFVDNVFVGFLDFAEDGDGFGTFWWMSLTGRVIDFDGLTLAVTESDLFPIDFVDVPCDALAFWDGCLSNFDCDDTDECTIDLCDVGVCVYAETLGDCDVGLPRISISFCGSSMGMAMMLTVFGLGAMRSRRRSGGYS